MTKQLHIISTGQQSMKRFVHVVQQVHEYVDAIHIREKKWTAKELSTAVQALIDKEVPREKIIINDRIDVAYMMKTRGVQLGYHSADYSLVRESFRDLQIGCSVHAPEEAIAAEKKGASYLLYGHVFSTASKPGLPPRGSEKIKEMRKQVTIPVIAIGGITPENTKEVVTAGAAGIAVLSGIFLAADPLKKARKYRYALDRAGSQLKGVNL